MSAALGYVLGVLSTLFILGAVKAMDWLLTRHDVLFYPDECEPEEPPAGLRRVK